MNPVIPVVGIDFGTSNSKMAWYNPATRLAEVLENDEGEKVTPSIVYFDENQTLVGTPAMEMLEDEQAWDRVIVSIKRSMVKAPVINLPDRAVKPVEVVAEILSKLKHDAKELHFHQEVQHAVITCPATFDGLERDEIKKAAQLAGFSEIELLPEPLAAALAYTLIREKIGFQVGNHVLVYDLGGGTFDLAVLVREKNESFRLGLEPQGIKQCGGDDFDEALYNYCDKLARERLGRSISISGERDLHFLYQCRKRKENLTNHKSRVFSSLLAPDSVNFKHEIDQETFERLIHDKVQQTVQKTKEMLMQAHSAGYNIDTFVLVGGASQVPLVKRMLDETLPLKGATWQQREVAVALGAAYHAHNTWNADEIGRLQSMQYRQAAETVWTDQKVDTTEQKEKFPTSEEVIHPDKIEDFTLVNTFTDHTGIVGSVAITPDRRTVASGSADQTVKLWDLYTGKLLRSLNEHGGGVYAVAIDPSGQNLVTCNIDGTLKIWNLNTGAQLYTFMEPTGWFVHATSLVISPDGRLLASGCRDKAIKFWNLQSGMQLRSLTGHTDIVWSVAFSSDGQFLASGSADRTVRLWNLRTATLIRTFTEHKSNILTVAFSPNGQLLSSGGDDQTIKFWNLRTGAFLRPLTGHTGSIRSTVFSPDGQILASGSLDGTIRLWHLRTGALIRTLTEHTGGVYSIVFSPDGQMLISGGADTTIKIWKRC